MTPLHNHEYIKDIDISSIMPDLHVDTISQLMQALANEAVKLTGGSATYLKKALLDQERTYNSALGEHVATPNLKLKNINKPVTILASLKNPLDMDAADRQHVDIVCLVLSPDKDGPVHLRRLSRLARHLKNKDLREKILNTEDKETIRTLIMDPDGWMLAA